MNAQSIDLIALRMIIRSTRKNITDLHKQHRSDPKSIASQEFGRYIRLMEKYQAWHIQKTGELYY